MQDNRKYIADFNTFIKLRNATKNADFYLQFQLSSDIISMLLTETVMVSIAYENDRMLIFNKHKTCASLSSNLSIIRACYQQSLNPPDFNRSFIYRGITMKIREAAKYSINNREQLLKSKIAGCYNCCEIFDVSEITDWTDGGITAFCPKCSIDSVLGDASPYKIDKITLQDLHKFWF